jgi:hypothetical protein
VEAAKASIAAALPAFVIQAARHLLTEADETTPRRLRFRVGPVKGETPAGESAAGETNRAEMAMPPGTAAPPSDADTTISDAGTTTGPKSGSSATIVQGDISRRQLWRREIDAIKAASSLPILILYAPVSPQIVDGRIVTETYDPKELAEMKSAANRAGLLVADAQGQLMRSAFEGNWPHGFHNGYIGSGHLNRTGNAVVGAVLVKQMFDALESLGAIESLGALETLGEDSDGEGN